VVADPGHSAESPGRVLLTGASGFVGGHLLRRLVRAGYTVVAAVRSARRLACTLCDAGRSRVQILEVDLFDATSLARAVGPADAAINAVGIIMEHHAAGQTFQRVHVELTDSLLAACRQIPIDRFVHISALGARPDAPSRYHQTKWEAEERIRQSGLRWTIFRPSLIHGPDGQFMHLMKQLTTGLFPPMLPCLGSGRSKLQPIFVDDLAEIVVASLPMERCVGQRYEIGGSERTSWKELYRTCRRIIPGARRRKPILGLPARVAGLVGRLGDWHDRRFGTRRPLGVLPGIPFNYDQVLMAQEDSICDNRPIEEAFGVRPRPFAEVLAEYAGSL
jgi:uncharacterized protein YbjT (DUF2867 family)